MDASVEFLLGNLKQLVLHHVNLIKGAENDFEKLNGELEELNAVLKDASKRRKKDEAFRVWERKVRDVVYKVEDMIDICVTQAANKSKRTSIARFFKGENATLAESVRSIRTNEIRPLFDQAKVDLAKLEIADDIDTTAETARAIRQKKSQNIVGFEQETDEFIDFLNGDSQELEVSSIIGMAGLGKTTLAWKIFEHQTIKYEFPVRIWVNISDVLNMKSVLLTILRTFTPNAQEDQHEHDMIVKVREQLKEGKFLIVMDDIWTVDVWRSIKEILPKENKLGRVLVTTRHRDVAENASSKDRAHYLRFLKHDESWQLLQYEVYGKLNAVPNELVGIGKVIATDCDGLPLSIVVIGGILAEKKGRALGTVKKEWEEISKSVKPYLVGGDKKNLLSSIIALSYEKLPYELRNCFIYLGVFPEDADIPVNKLIRLWIAEGFVQGNGTGQSLEQVAYENLKDLINRNLVMVRKSTIDGEPKVCHIHDSVREICKSQASFHNLNLFQEIEKGASEGSGDNIDKCRRICIHSYVLDFLKKKKKIPTARSFLCFHDSAMNLKAADMAYVTDGFGLLRVYDAKNIKFPKFPQKLVQLLHLRYLTLVMDQCATLPENISDLWNLQTLTVDISSHVLDMKVDIWKMRQLRHFKTKASIVLRRDGKGEGGENLQTLSRLSSESCTDDVFKRAKNLITLGIQGDLNKIGSLTCFEILDRLNKLKLVHEGTDGVAGEGPMRRVPESQNFPPNLKILVLCSTYLDWNKMEVLSRLSVLEVLKLKENAFRGKTWEAEYSGFRHLERLHIERASELLYWTAIGNPFPKLKILVLNNCENLIEIPPVIGESLELMSLERVTQALVSSAEKIKANLDKKPDLKVRKELSFKLEIARGDRR